MNIAFFSSYNGSSAQKITTACFDGDIMASPALLITNNPNASALDWAENLGLKIFVINAKTHPEPMERDKAIADKLRENKITLSVLSGYMKLIGPETIQATNDRMINVHPALLPKYGGEGMYGRYVHQAVKDNNDTETGATIHQVNTAYDEGKILAQKSVPILSTDTVEDIENKVKALEPDLYIETVRKILKGQITL